VVADDAILQAALRLGRLVGVEDATDVSGDLGTHGQRGHVRHGVTDRVELATLPRDPGHDGLTGGSQSGCADHTRPSPQAGEQVRGAAS
jgi:hypothetical protein